MLPNKEVEAAEGGAEAVQVADGTAAIPSTPVAFANGESVACIPIVATLPQTESCNGSKVGFSRSVVQNGESEP